MPQVHHYHPDTGLYLGSTDADESPLEPGVYLVPAGATLDQPPQPGANQSPVYSDGQWTLVPDYLGHRYWLADGSEHTIEALGQEPPADALTEKPPEPITEIAARKRSEIELARKAAEADGVIINGVRYAGDASNRQALNEALQFAQASGAIAFGSWKDSDGKFHADHPVSDVQQALMAIAQLRGELIGIEGDLNAAIALAAQAGDRETLDAITWGMEP